GDIVKKGQVLIAPYVEINGEQKSVRARGDVKASVFIKGQVVFNESGTQKVKSGKSVTVRSLQFFNTIFPCLSEKVPFNEYEIEKSCKNICKNMPICIKIIEERYYEIIEVPINKSFDDEKDLLIKKSRYLAYENLQADFDVISEQTDIVIAGENYYITTYLKVNTNIGVTDYESDI
ncbi:MAG: sporulation protein YqfD, partial [Christensenellales bacterium]